MVPADFHLIPSKLSLLREISWSKTVIFVATLLFVLIFGCTGNAGAVQIPEERSGAVINEHAEKSNQAGSNISVVVNGVELRNGEQITTGKNPQMKVHIQSKNLLESVLIRIDGQTSRAYSPNTHNHSITTTLNLRDGGHSVDVIVNSKTTAVHSVTIVEDAIGPRINFQEPFTTTDKQPPDQNYTLNTSNITLRGELIDRSSVRRVIINHRYEYTFNGDQTERSRYVIEEPDGSFSQQLKLGPNRKNQTNGTNHVTVETVDVKDNHRKYSFILNISDTEPPDIVILDTTPLYEQSKVALKVQVADNVGISEFGRQLGSGNMTGLRSYYSEIDIYQQRQEHTTTVELDASLARNGISLFATDLVENNDTLDYSLDYEEFAAPKIAINTDATQMIGTQTAIVSGTINQGRFSHAEIEVRTSEGTLSDIIVLQTGQTANYLEFNKSVQVDSSPATIHIRVRDVTGTEHTKDYKLVGEDLQQTPQPTSTVSASTPVPQSSTTTTKAVSTTSAVTSQTATPEQKPTRPSPDTQPVLLTSIAEYLLSILPYTLASAIFTVVLYIIARKVIAS